MRQWIAALAITLAGVFQFPPADAQVQSATSPVFAYLDPQGVDVTTDAFRASSTEVVIGNPGAGGLVQSRTWIGTSWRDDLAGTISSSGSIYTVSLGSQSETFTGSGGSFTSDQHIGSTLALASNVYTYTLRDGTVAVFDHNLRDVSGVSNFWANNEGEITSLTRPDGEVITWTYTTASHPTYGTVIRPQSISNNLGYQIHFEYDGTDTMLRVKAIGINRAYYYCDDTWNSCSDTGGSQNWPYVTYGGTVGSLEIVTDRLSQATKFEFTSGLMTGIRRPTAGSTNFIAIGYTSGLVSSVSIGGQTWTYSTACAGGPCVAKNTSVTSPNGVVAWYQFNVAHGWVNTIYKDTTGTRTTSYARYPDGRIYQITDASGDVTTLTLDDRGNATDTVFSKPSSPLTPITTHAHFPTCSAGNTKTCNQPDYTTNASGFVTIYQYPSLNAHGGVTVVTLPAPSGSTPYGSGIQPETRLTYTQLTPYYLNSSSVMTAGPNAIWRLTGTSACMTTSSCSGGSDETKSTFSYGASSANNLLLTGTTAGSGDGSLSVTSTATYSAQGDVATVSGPISGATTSYYYDDMRRLRATVSPDPDGGGGLLNRVVRMTYDADGRPTAIDYGTVSSPAGWNSLLILRTQTMTYDSTTALPLQTALTAPGQTYPFNLQQYGFDNDRRALCSTVRMNRTTFNSISVDACTLTTTGTDGPDRIHLTGYDPTHGDVNGEWSAYNTVDVRPDVAVVSDPATGHLNSLTNARSYVTSYHYDDYNRLDTIHYPNPLATGSSSTATSETDTISYDGAGRIYQRQYRDTNSFTYTYDNLDRVQSITGPDPTVSFNYDNLGRVTQATRSGNTTSYGYDALSRLTSETEAGRTVSYEYDAAGRRTKVTWPDAFYVCYGYDLVDEMTSIVESCNGSATTLATFTYDDSGGRTSLTRGNSSVTGYGYDDAERLTTLAHSFATNSAYNSTATLSYNAANQITSRNLTTSYVFPTPSIFYDAYAADGLDKYTTARSITPTYDSRGNMTYDGANSYTYDYSNRMTTAGSATLTYDPEGRLFQVAASSTTQFLYEGSEMIAEYDGSGTLLRRYVHGPGVDEPLVLYDGAGRNYLFADERRSIVNIENGSGPATPYTYDEYGRRGSSNAGRFEYTGQVWLDEVGLYYYKARFYSPTLGRFMQTDPIGYDSAARLYTYTSNEPINYSDPSGLIQICEPHSKLHIVYTPGSGTTPDKYGMAYTYFKTCNDDEADYTSAIYTSRRIPSGGGGSSASATHPSDMCPATTFTAVQTPFGDVQLPDIAPGEHLAFAGGSGSAEFLLGLGAGSGVYRYNGADGNKYQGNYLSLSFGLGAGAEGAAGGGLSNNIGSFFGWSVNTNGTVGFVKGTASANFSGPGASLNLALGADFSADATATYPVGAPVKVSGDC